MSPAWPPNCWPGWVAVAEMRQLWEMHGRRPVDWGEAIVNARHVYLQPTCLPTPSHSSDEAANRYSLFKFNGLKLDPLACYRTKPKHISTPFSVNRTMDGLAVRENVWEIWFLCKYARVFVVGRHGSVTGFKARASPCLDDKARVEPDRRLEYRICLAVVIRRGQ